MRALFAIIRFISGHPLSKGRQLDAIFRFIKWQLGTKLIGNRVVVNWVNDARFITRKGETGLTGNLYCGFAEFEDMAFVLHYLRSSDEFYDIGANVGAYTILASSVKGCKSHAFEPLPDTFDRLVDQIKINRIEKLASIRNCGVGAKAEVLEFTNTHNTTNKVNTDPNNKNVTEVPVISLDEEFKPQKSSVVKIDVEGYEKFVFEGGADFFKNQNVEALVVELNGSGNLFGVSDAQLDATIRKFGFSAIAYDPFERSLVKMDGFNDGGNTIYVKDLAAASKRCNSSQKVVIHTAGGILL